MGKILFITLADIDSNSNSKQGYAYVSCQTMPIKHIASGILPEDGDEFLVSIDDTSRLLYKCLNRYTKPPFIVEGHDAVISAIFISRV